MSAPATPASAKPANPKTGVGTSIPRNKSQNVPTMVTRVIMAHSKTRITDNRSLVNFHLLSGIRCFCGAKQTHPHIIRGGESFSRVMPGCTSRGQGQRYTVDTSRLPGQTLHKRPSHSCRYCQMTLGRDGFPSQNHEPRCGRCPLNCHCT
jgi:hypothetical protein